MARKKIVDEAPVEAVETIELPESNGTPDVEFDDVDADKGPVEPELYEHLRFENDGVHGLPVFTEGELRVINKNLLVETNTINVYVSQCKTFSEMITTFDKTIYETPEEAEVEFTNFSDMYNSARNVLVKIQKSHDDYIAYIKENKAEILKNVNNLSSRVIKSYVTGAEATFGTMFNEDSLANFIVATGIRRKLANKNGEIERYSDFLMTAGDADKFESAVQKIISSAIFFVSNGGTHNDPDYPCFEEREIAKIITNLTRWFGKISSNAEGNFVEESDSPAVVLNLFENLKAITGKRFYYEFKTERTKHDSLVKKLKKRKAGDKVPCSDKFLRTRFTALMVETLLKEWFSISLYGDPKFVKDKALFIETFKNIGSIPTGEVVLSVINSVAFSIFFDELELMISTLRDNSESHLDTKQINIVKHYLLFVEIFARSKDTEASYGSEELYSELVNKISTY